MKRLRNTLIASATMALAVSAISAPAAAAPGATLAVVHGIPGVKVDLCVNGGALKKNFRYGQKVVVDGLAAGRYNIKVKLAANARPCKGATVLKTKPTLAGTENLTVVAGFKKGLPALRVFDHDAALSTASIGQAADGSAVIAAHAAKAGPVDIYAATVVVPAAPTPTVANLRRGQAVGLAVPVTQWSVWVAAPGKIKPIIGPVYKPSVSGKINHYVAVGTNVGNYKLVFFRTTIDDA